MEDRLLSKKELAKYLAFSVRQIDRFMQKGEVPYLIVGSSVRFRLSEINEWLSKLQTTGSRRAK